MKGPGYGKPEDPQLMSDEREIYIEVKEWAPSHTDYDPGIIADLENMVPVKKGYASHNGIQDWETNGLGDICRGACLTFSAAGIGYVVAGTYDNLFSVQVSTVSGPTATLSAWTDRTTGTYSSSPAKWRFAQFGNITIAASGIAMEDLQYVDITTAAAFSSVSGMKAAYICTWGQFVLATNIQQTAGYGVLYDGWQCCAYGDYTDWTPDVATQCVYGRLVDSPGPTTGILPLNDNVIIYKNSAIYVGTYVGPPSVWQWDKISSTIGCTAPDTLVDIGDKHFFMARDGFYIFDGSSIQRVGSQIWDDRIPAMNTTTTADATVDTINKFIYITYLDTSIAPSKYKFLVYNYELDKWGSVNHPSGVDIECVRSLSHGMMDWDRPGTPYIRAALVMQNTGGPSSSNLGWADFDPELLSNTTDWTIKFGRIGDDHKSSLLKGAKLRAPDFPSGSDKVYFRTYVSDDGKTFSMGTWDYIPEGVEANFMQEARWHKIQFDTGAAADSNIVIKGYTINIEGGSIESA